MLIEATERPIRYRWPEGEIRLEPGKPVNVPDERRALKVLAKCQAKVKVINPDWLSAWEFLAARTDGISKTDPRFEPVCQALEDCDRYFEQGDWTRFQSAAEVVRAIVMGGK